MIKCLYKAIDRINLYNLQVEKSSLYDSNLAYNAWLADIVEANGNFSMSL